MLIKVRNDEGKLFAKDILDIDFDMFVVESKDPHGNSHYSVRLNDKFILDEEYDSPEAAELALDHIVECRNGLEEELRRY